MKSKVFYLKIIVLILIILNGVTFHELQTKTCEVDFCFNEKNNEYVLVEKNIVNKSIRSYLYKNKNDEYLSEIYDYETNQELSINDLVKSEYLENFYEKIKELLEKKYPKFIADGLIEENVLYSYVLRDNELVIYFNNYNISPSVEEVLYLKVNYNEIKDYLNFTVLLDSNYENESGYNYTPAKKAVAITFDDSPNNEKTNQILDTLSDNYAHATFFVLGDKIKNNKNILISMKNKGNEIGSHSYSHKQLTKLTEEEYINDYNKVNELYYNLFNENLKLLRPPYGSIKNSQLNLLPVSYIMWSLDTNDWRYKSSDYLVNYVIDNIKDGDIILFHDSYSSTVSAVSKLLPILYSKGYQVMSVSELAKLKNCQLEDYQIYHKFK